MKQPWTPEDTTLLMRLWRAGYRTNKIADHLGITRNAVAGKLHRLGLQGQRGSPLWGNRTWKGRGVDVDIPPLQREPLSPPGETAARSTFIDGVPIDRLMGRR